MAEKKWLGVILGGLQNFTPKFSWSYFTLLKKLITGDFGPLHHLAKLVGGWTNLSEKYARQIGENKKMSKPPPSISLLWS